jgi:hypothetical protein
MEFWHWLVIFFIYIPLILLWVFTLIDIFGRHDLSGWVKALWVILVVLLPIIGMLVYFIFRPFSAQDEAMQKQVRENQELYRAAQGTEQLYALQHLLETGQISQEKYEKRKARIIAKMQ